jgi:membrane protein implicated in regulation of membrane protease activity
MALFQGLDVFFWFWVVIALTVLTALITWYWVITGRDRKPRKQRRGEETIERYGSIEEDRAPLPKFLIWTYVGVAIWALGYALWTGIAGLGV